MSAFNIVAVVQAGRLQYEAVLLAASLRTRAPGFAGKLFLAEPQPGPTLEGRPTGDGCGCARGAARPWGDVFAI